ncbi:3-hydroxyacyl-CoA dehydrogenase [Streptomyces sp. ICBB 8177]|uniref:3-hydroxyacyl-CoA dehydrogenase n=1 Tax=Streptomyces sp. ICBB 8177 TaxID=563922 RepID=UPI000D680152|nr:3-hydroxyacyl-CoA dehydrogenase [Streptomyces sp. ICBB 8177]PWI41176.1 3-hydroxyacyl-CoA dehydrogenase [Streptomyces sp. ICBB 8177]
MNSSHYGHSDDSGRSGEAGHSASGATASGATASGATGSGAAGDRVTVAVVGTGTMGQGIAQVALAAGHPVLLYDVAEGFAARAAEAIGARLDRLVEKGRMTAEQRDAARAAATPVTGLERLAPAGLVIEAVAERLEVKQRLFADLEEVVGDDCVLATNTSSLSVTAIAGALRRPERFLGLHFFNPAPLLPLVEVVSGHATAPAVADFGYATALGWGKTPVRCTDTPGFVVNRVARPFYAEAFAALEDRVADPATIDAVLRESGGFRMGPFELTDLIGQDVNEAVTRSVWEAFFQHPKFTPSLAQRRLVESGRHGRKSGAGWFRYDDPEGGGGTGKGSGGGAGRPAPHTAPPATPPARVGFTDGPPPVRELVAVIEKAGIGVDRDEAAGYGVVTLPGGARLTLADGTYAADSGGDTVQYDLALDYAAATRVAIAHAPGARAGAVDEAIGLFQALGKQVSVVRDSPGLIVARTVAMLVDFAADAVAKGVATPEDVDTAMRLGVNYPLGPVEWGARLTPGWVRGVLRALHAHHPTGRYAPSVGLRRWYASPEGVLSS